MAQRNKERNGEKIVIGAAAHIERIKKGRGEIKIGGGGNPTKGYHSKAIPEEKVESSKMTTEGVKHPGSFKGKDKEKTTGVTTPTKVEYIPVEGKVSHVSEKGVKHPPFKGVTPGDKKKGKKTVTTTKVEYITDSDTHKKYRVSPGGSTVEVKQGQYTFKFRKSRYEGHDLEADPQVGEGEQGGTHRTKTPNGDNNSTPPLSKCDRGYPK